MTVDKLIYVPLDTRRTNVALVSIFIIYVACVTMLALKHVMWRDEVRALSLALSGGDLIAMLKSIRNEGHPFLWYVLLRVFYEIFHSVYVLPALAWVIGIASAYLLAFHSRFNLAFVSFCLFGDACLYEYSVVARNYGISMLLMFIWAVCYRRCREKGITLGVLLLLLENSNFYAVIVSGALMLYWFLDLLQTRNLPRSVWVNFFVNAALACGGLILFALVVHPDKSVIFVGIPRDAASEWWNTFLRPERGFGTVSGYAAVWGLAESLALGRAWTSIAGAALGCIMLGSAAGLARQWHAVLAAVVAFFGMSYAFNFLYPGAYRHQALWLILLIVLYWVAAPSSESDAGEPVWRTRVATAGALMFFVLLGWQVAISILVFFMRVHGYPESCIQALAVTIKANSALANAIIVSEPDFFIDAFPYYMNNDIYLIREHRYGKWIDYKRSSVGPISLGEIYDSAVNLKKETGRPVVIVLGYELDGSKPVDIHHSGQWLFFAMASEVRQFTQASSKINDFPSKRCVEESYDVYVMR